MKTHILLLILYLQAFHSIGQTFTINGTVANYANQSLYIYQCYGDTLLLVDSVKTNAQGNFTFSRQHLSQGLYRFNLPNNQWFYILNDGHPVVVKTVYQFSAFYNIATDSLKVLQSEENKKLYAFQHLQQTLNIANTWLLQMIRLYPIIDPFHPKIEAEYLARYKAMNDFINHFFKACNQFSRFEHFNHLFLCRLGVSIVSSLHFNSDTVCIYNILFHVHFSFPFFGLYQPQFCFGSLSLGGFGGHPRNTNIIVL